jgi:CRP-like cAMP-binding protein
VLDKLEAEWLDLIRDVNETLDQMDGGGRHSLVAGSDHWLQGLRKSPTFARLTADKLAAVLTELEEVPTRTGDVIVRQKDAGDYFYVIKSGTFTVSRRTGPGEVEILAQLGEGDSFGEAALLSDEARNASVVADGEGVLLRLARDRFNELVRTELVRHVSMAEAERLVRDGARLLDVRRDSPGNADTPPGALVIPLDQLRARLAEIDPRTPYVICCLNGNLSETAAFVLSQRRYRVYVLKGGLRGLA